MHRNTPGENIITSLLQVITSILMDDVITGDVNVTHYSDVIMGMMVSQITNLAIVYSTIYSDADQRKHQSSVSLAFVPVTGEFPAQGASNTENASVWWRHHGLQWTWWTRSAKFLSWAEIWEFSCCDIINDNNCILHTLVCRLKFPITCVCVYLYIYITSTGIDAKERLRWFILTTSRFNAINVGYYLQHWPHLSCTIELYEGQC